MNYIVIDLEWNQCLRKRDRITEPVRLRGEIIQIGAVKLDEKYAVTDTMKIMVSPVHYKEMHEKVSEITDITTEDLENGLSFPDAMEKFRAWCGDEFVFFTWGLDDISMLCDNMQLHHMDTEWLPVTYNLQLTFDKQISKENRQISLARAMEMLGEPALKFHDALNDALNTAKICLHLDMENGLAGCELTGHLRRRRAKNVLLTHKLDKIYPSRRQALKEQEVISFYYPDFDEEIVCSGFVEQSSRSFMAVGCGESGRELFVRFNFRKKAEKEFSVSRVVYEMDDENRRYYKKRLKRTRQAKAKYFHKGKKQSNKKLK